MAAEPVRIIGQWSEQESVVIPLEVQKVLLEEISAAALKVAADPMLAPKFEAAMIDTATLEYLNNLNRDNKSPAVLSIMVNLVREDGIGRVYPSIFPKLNLTSSFVMTSVILNDKEVDIEDSQEVELWLNLGTNEVETRGGGSANCIYTIIGEKGKSYDRACSN